MNTCGQLLGVTAEQITDSMKAALEAQKHYERLLTLTPNGREAAIITMFIEEEKELLDLYKDLFKSMTCTPLVIPTLTKPVFTSYVEGLKTAIANEVKQFYFVKELYISTSVTGIQKIVYYGAQIAMEHLSYLNLLFIEAQPLKSKV